MSNHTPAPWCAVKTGDYRAAFRVTDKDGWTIALCYQQPRDEWSVEANVNLMLAAPDLLAACKQLLDNSGPLCDYSTWRNSILVARAAIAKATGEQT